MLLLGWKWKVSTDSLDLRGYYKSITNNNRMLIVLSKLAFCEERFILRRIASESLLGKLKKSNFLR